MKYIVRFIMCLLICCLWVLDLVCAIMLFFIGIVWEFRIVEPFKYAFGGFGKQNFYDDVLGKEEGEMIEYYRTPLDYLKQSKKTRIYHKPSHF